MRRQQRFACISGIEFSHFSDPPATSRDSRLLSAGRTGLAGFSESGLRPDTPRWAPAPSLIDLKAVAESTPQTRHEHANERTRFLDPLVRVLAAGQEVTVVNSDCHGGWGDSAKIGRNTLGVCHVAEPPFFAAARPPVLPDAGQVL